MTITTALAGCGKNEPAANPKGKKVDVPAKAGDTEAGDTKAGDTQVEPKGEGPVTISGISADWQRDEFEHSWKLVLRADFTLRPEGKYLQGTTDVYAVCGLGGKRMGDWASGPSEMDPGKYSWENAIFGADGLREKPSQCEIAFRYREGVEGLDDTIDEKMVRTVCVMDTKIVDGPCPNLPKPTPPAAKGRFVRIELVSAKPKDAHPGYVLEVDADITLLQDPATVDLNSLRIGVGGTCEAGGKPYEYKRRDADRVWIYSLEPGDAIPFKRNIFLLSHPLSAQPTKCEIRFDVEDREADDKVVEQTYFCWRAGEIREGRCK